MRNEYENEKSVIKNVGLREWEGILLNLSYSSTRGVLVITVLSLLLLLRVT